MSDIPHTHLIELVSRFTASTQQSTSTSSASTSLLPLCWGRAIYSIPLLNNENYLWTDEKWMLHCCLLHHKQWVFRIFSNVSLSSKLKLNFICSRFRAALLCFRNFFFEILKTARVSRVWLTKCCGEISPLFFCRARHSTVIERNTQQFWWFLQVLNGSIFASKQNHHTQWNENYDLRVTRSKMITLDDRLSTLDALNFLRLIEGEE